MSKRVVGQRGPYLVHGAVFAMLILLQAPLGSAHAADACPSDWGGDSTGDPRSALRVTEWLETTWNVGDSMVRSKRYVPVLFETA
jgi:hypothetical protein